MKKVIALLLALVMSFSFMTFAFAEEVAGDVSNSGEGSSEAAPANPFEDMTEEEIMDMIMNLDMGQVKVILKVAKIAVKLAFVMDTLGIIDLSPIKNAILDMVWGLVSDYIPAPAVA